ncbi:MAG: ribosome-associated translation inhibitor RaiA [Coriobacteriales bacterium]|nr:ribosome-associated translation inhibitor RaiA [Coriobacteriales bacterium]
MEITVVGRKLQVSDKMREYVHDKIGGAMKVFDIEPLTAEVILRKQKGPKADNNAAEVTVRTKGHVIRAEGVDEDLFTAIDEAADKVTRQMRKFKTKVIDRRSRARIADQPYFEEVPAAAPAAPEEDEEAVVRVKYVELQNLSEEDALIQCDLLGHDFFIYNDAVTGLTNVMYRREGGGYGIIKPKLPDPEQAL